MGNGKAILEDDFSDRSITDPYPGLDLPASERNQNHSTQIFYADIPLSGSQRLIRKGFHDYEKVRNLAAGPQIPEARFLGTPGSVKLLLPPRQSRDLPTD